MMKKIGLKLAAINSFLASGFLDKDFLSKVFLGKRLLRKSFVINGFLVSVFLAGCAGTKTVTQAPPSPANESASSQSTKQPNTGQTGNNNAVKPGGYYLDDGPGDNPPLDIDSIPNAIPKLEPLLARANKPYKALGVTYTPMTSYQPYNFTGVASWYGKRYHGKKTSSGEVYDMYAMTAAHPTLPLPSYVKVTNPANGRSVIVRVNDRGPFKGNRLIDLSYAAAYKLRFATNGSSLVAVQAIDASNFAMDAQANSPSNTAVNATSGTVPASRITTSPVGTSSVTSSPVTASTNEVDPANKFPNQSNTQIVYFVQAGAFKYEVNAGALMKKIQGLNISQNAEINSVYNNGLYRLKVGPFENKQQAEQVASRIRKQLNTAAVTTIQ